MNTQTFLEEAAKLERLLYCVAWSMLSNSDDCADAVQETLMRAWQSRDTLRNLRSFRPWITRIMVNTCNTMLRKRLNQRWVPLEEDMAVLDAPQDSGFDLDETLGRLSPEHRAVVVLHYLEGYKVRENRRNARHPRRHGQNAPDDGAGPYSEKSGSLSAGRRRTQS